MLRKEDALRYHREGRPGKIALKPTKPIETQRDLSLAYSPGVAEPCREIHEDQQKVGLYTARNNLVAVVTNGTAVLGLGNIGPYAAKPVMEGKAVLFKKYADIDVFDIEVDAQDPEKLIEVVAALEPTFGGINLEDIKAPDCFRVEKALKERMKIPVFHDDQHGTAIISAAALLNAAEIQKHELTDLNVVCIGAGAAAISCMHLWMRFGVPKESIVMLDRHGVIFEGREGLTDPNRGFFAVPANDPRRTLEDAMKGANVMIGLSGGGLVSGDMVKTMSERPIIFALANPNPEIPYDEAKKARPDAVIGTGRSDFPNQVNNVLGFPYIFRGALDVQATHINEPMKIAAARALADLTREIVPDDVRAAYGGESIRFGPDYIIPKPVDGRSLSWVASAVAEAALESGVAGKQIDVSAYREELERKLSPTRRVMWRITSAARSNPKRIVFPEGEEEKILKAAAVVAEERIAQPILIGRPSVVRSIAEKIGVDLSGVEIVDRQNLPNLDEFAEQYWHGRQRRGLTKGRAWAELEHSRTHYGMMMVHRGVADGLVSGLTAPYPNTIRPALKIVGVRDGVHRASGMYMVITPKDVKFLADTTINIEPDAQTLAETAILSADLVRDLGITPRIAMLSFSNFGDAPHASSIKVAKATAMVKAARPDLMIDGEMQADVALTADARATYPFSTLRQNANILVFPNLDAGNIAYKLLASTDGGTVIGPLVLGMKRPVNVLQQGASVDTIVHMTSITVTQAHRIDRVSQLPPEP